MTQYYVQYYHPTKPKVMLLHNMLPLDAIGCVCIAEWLCHVSGPCSAVRQHLPAAFRLRVRKQHSWTAGVARQWDFVVITESHATVASENLWSVDFKPGSTHNDSLFMKLSEIWSGINTECFILKLTRCFNVSVSDYLSRSMGSVLNCCVVLHHLAKIEALRICCRWLGIIRAAME